MKRLIAVLCILLMSLTACTGSFRLTGKVYDIHRSQSDKWVDELIFLGVVIVPIYGIAMLADAIVFNSIEFWSGKNPVTAKTGVQEKVNENAGEKVVMHHDVETGRIEIRATTQDEAIYLDRTENGIVVRNEKGDIIYKTQRDSDGTLSVLDANGNVLALKPSQKI